MNKLILDKNFLDKKNKRVIIYEEIPVAIIKCNGKFFAFDNRCPHRGGALYKGEIKKGYISCPVHNWKFNLNSGFCLENDNIKINKFKVEELKNNIIINFD